MLTENRFLFNLLFDSSIDIVDTTSIKTQSWHHSPLGENLPQLSLSNQSFFSFPLIFLFLWAASLLCPNSLQNSSVALISISLNSLWYGNFSSCLFYTLSFYFLHSKLSYSYFYFQSGSSLMNKTQNVLKCIETKQLISCLWKTGMVIWTVWMTKILLGNMKALCWGLVVSPKKYSGYSHKSHLTKKIFFFFFPWKDRSDRRVSWGNLF